MTAAPGGPPGSCPTACRVASALTTGTVSSATSGVRGGGFSRQNFFPVSAQRCEAACLGVSEFVSSWILTSCRAYKVITGRCTLLGECRDKTEPKKTTPKVVKYRVWMNEWKWIKGTLCVCDLSEAVSVKD